MRGILVLLAAFWLTALSHAAAQTLASAQNIDMPQSLSPSIRGEVSGHDERPMKLASHLNASLINAAFTGVKKPAAEAFASRDDALRGYTLGEAGSVIPVKRILRSSQVEVTIPEYAGIFDNAVKPKLAGHLSTDWRGADSWDILETANTDAALGLEGYKASQQVIHAEPFPALEAIRSQKGVKDLTPPAAGLLQASFPVKETRQLTRSHPVSVVHVNPVRENFEQLANLSLVKPPRLSVGRSSHTLSLGPHKALVATGRLGSGRAPEAALQAAQKRLQGDIYVDLNRDGIRQQDEPGLPDVIVQSSGTLSPVKADITGHYSLESVANEPIVISVQSQTLPLGYTAVARSIPNSKFGGVTASSVNIPVRRSGQVRGALFIDIDGDGSPSVGDERLEGERVQLIDTASSDVRDVSSSALGQFGFEDVAPGKYKLRVQIGWQEIYVDAVLTDRDMLQAIPIPVPPALIGIDLNGEDGASDLTEVALAHKETRQIALPG